MEHKFFDAMAQDHDRKERSRQRREQRESQLKASEQQRAATENEARKQLPEVVKTYDSVAELFRIFDPNGTCAQSRIYPMIIVDKGELSTSSDGLGMIGVSVGLRFTEPYRENPHLVRNWSKRTNPEISKDIMDLYLRVYELDYDPDQMIGAVLPRSSRRQPIYIDSLHTYEVNNFVKRAHGHRKKDNQARRDFVEAFHSHDRFFEIADLTIAAVRQFEQANLEAIGQSS